VVASGPPDLDRAERFGAQLDPERLLKRNDSRLARADSLAWLTGSEAGRVFLEAPLPRAIARGDPPRTCPATGLAAGDPAGRGSAVRTALSRCLDALPAAAKDCGCELVAVDSVLTVPRDEMAYATGVTARVRAPEAGFDGLLIAEDETGGAILLRDVTGPVARITRPADGRAALEFLGGGPRFEGIATPVGYRRGRLAERLYLANADGSRAVVLIGFSPGELAESAGAGLAWPRDG